MSIYLSGVKIPGYGQKVSANLKLKSVDTSGESSYTPRAEAGDKPKTISVSTQIKYIDDDQLSLIIRLAEAKNGNDERSIYNIINLTANAMGIRQVKFDGDVQAREDGSLELWTVTFELAEYNSVAEKKEQRKKAKKVKEQAPAGTAASAAATPAASGTEPVDQAVELTDFEKKLKAANDWIGK